MEGKEPQKDESIKLSEAEKQGIIKELSDKLKKVLDFAIRLEDDDPRFDKITGGIGNFPKTYMEEFPEKTPRSYDKFTLHHVLAGSTPADNEHFPYFDFPGEYSVQKFINKLYDEYILNKKLSKQF